MIRQQTPGAGASPPSRLSTEAENTVDSRPRLGATLSTGQQAAPRIISASPGRKSFENLKIKFSPSPCSTLLDGPCRGQRRGSSAPPFPLSLTLSYPPKRCPAGQLPATSSPKSPRWTFICWTYLFWNLLYLLIGYILLFWRRD